MVEQKKKETKTFVYDRNVVKDISIIPRDEKFCLSDGYYFNEDKTIFIKSSDFAGKILKPNGSKTII